MVGVFGCVPSAIVRSPAVRSVLRLGRRRHDELHTFAVVDARSWIDKPMHLGTFEIEVEGAPTRSLTWPRISNVFFKARGLTHVGWTHLKPICH